MTAHRFLGTLVYFAIAVLFLPGFAPRAFGGDTASRPIASLSVNERMKLPGETHVTLHSGRTTTLAALRKEHELRMERFKTAAQLSKAIAGKLSKPVAGAAKAPPSAQVTMPGLKQNAGGAGSKTGMVAGAQQMPGNPTSIKGGAKSTGAAAASSFEALPHPAVLETNKLLSMEPNTYIASQQFLPRDYLAACGGAVTACLYLPANTDLWVVAMMNVAINNLMAEDEDPLITDQSVCFYDGGSIKDGSCVFDYPLSVLENFKPSGKLATTASCDPSMHFILDQMGAIKVWFGGLGGPPSPPGVFNPGTPATCAVQVWISQ